LSVFQTLARWEACAPGENDFYFEPKSMKENLKENLKPVIFIAIVLVLTAISAYPQRKFAGTVTEVIDGRTCVIQLSGRKVTAVLQYIETPEPEQPLYQTVREHLAKLVLGKTVEFLPRIVMRDRTAGQLMVKGVDVSQQMLRDGAAWYSIPEKSGQDPVESLLYIDNETQAKTEKRGVWSVADLKPSWEFRAEQEALERQKNEEAYRQAAAVREQEIQKKRKIVPQRQQVATQGEIWANVGGPSQYDQPLGIGGLRTGYNSEKGFGYIFTPSIFLDFPKSDFLTRVETRLFYVYKGERTAIERSVYMIAFFAISKNPKFVKSNNLVITADGQKIVLGKARRYVEQDARAVYELLAYKITRAQIMKIAKAERISVQIGTYNGAISTDSLEMINNLINAS
jgi:endonuclease YncB( thermonuclease family)